MSRLLARPVECPQGDVALLGAASLFAATGDRPPTRGRAARRLLGLALSFAAHAALLLWLLQSPGLRSGSGAAEPRVMALILPNRPTPVVPAEDPLATPIATPPAAPPSPARVARAKPVGPERAMRPNRPAAPSDAPTESAIAAATAAEPAALVAATPQSPAATSGGAEPPDDILRRYGETVWMLITKRKPRGARFAGTAVVTFAIAPDGAVRSAEISASSGSAMLDRLALDALQEASPFPPPPPGITAEQATFTIPFEFR